MELEIGDLVTWKVGNMQCKGIVRDEPQPEGFVEVLIGEINGRRARTLAYPNINILTKVDHEKYDIRRNVG